MPFPLDPTVEVTGQPEWWLCPLCRTAILGAFGSRR
jgi:hypothetical protein